MTFALTALLCLAAGAAPAFAATYYVATNGSDSANGSQASPWRTIAHAVRQMNAGDTTYVRGGTYNERLIAFRKSGTASAPIKLLNAPGESPVVDFGVTTSNNVINRFEIDATGPGTVPIGHITIEGFEIRRGWDGIKFISAHDITIRRNWIHRSKAQGILGRGINILIDRNVLSQNGWDNQFDHGMYLTGSNYVITNNLIYANATFGIQVAGYLWKGSAIYKPVEGAAPDRRYAGASNFLIANNTFGYNGAAGIVIWQSEAENNKVINNIFYENSADPKRDSNSVNGVAFLGSGRGNAINNNLFFASGSGGTVMISRSATEGVHYTQSGNITANPNFVGAGPTLSGVPNFQLQPSSPAIDKGQSLSQVTWDHAGGKRPFGPTHDIGAFEYGAPPDSGSPPPNPTGDGTTPTPENCPPVGIEAAGNPFAPTDPPPATGPITPPPASGAGNTYWVATNGSNSNPGTQAAPFRTIRHAVSKMNAGDTTYVRGGTYTEDTGGEHETSGVWFSRSGTDSAPIRLINAPGESPVIDCHFIKGNTIAIKNAAGHRTPTGNIVIEGFEIRNCHVGVKMYSGYNIVIRRNWIHHATAQGILGDGKNVLIDRNVINHNGKFDLCKVNASVCNKEHGIYGTGPNWTVTNNLIYDNLSYGVHVAGYEHCPGRVCPSGSTTYTKDFADASWSGADGWIIANNTIAYHNYRAGIALWQSRTTNSKIINNILYENAQVDGGAQGIEFINSGGGHVIQNNLCYATSPGRTACIGASGAGKYTQSGNIVNTVNPGFVSAGPTISGTPNFQLQPSSPAIDKGLSLPQVTWDHAGGKRPFGAAFDIGAYEHGAPPDSGSPPPNPTGGGGSTGGISVPPGCPPPFVPDTYIQCIPPDP